MTGEGCDDGNLDRRRWLSGYDLQRSPVCGDGIAHRRHRHRPGRDDETCGQHRDAATGRHLSATDLSAVGLRRRRGGQPGRGMRRWRGQLGHDSGRLSHRLLESDLSATTWSTTGERHATDLATLIDGDHAPQERQIARNPGLTATASSTPARPSATRVSVTNSELRRRSPAVTDCQLSGCVTMDVRAPYRRGVRCRRSQLGQRHPSTALSHRQPGSRSDAGVVDNTATDTGDAALR